MADDYQLYVLVIPEATRRNQDQDSQQNLSVQGLLNDAVGTTTTVSSEPADQRLRGNYVGRYADKMATELAEIGSNGTIEALGLTGVSGQSSIDGYYAVESVNKQPPSPQSRSLNSYDISLRRQGTRSTHRREVTTAGALELSHPFGNDVGGYVSVPATATGVRWLNPDTDETDSASPAMTRSAELSDVDEYRLSDAPYSSPSLIYDIDYAAEGAVDVRVFDSMAGDKLDDNGNLRWAKVFDPSHEYGADAEAIIDNGLVRLRANPLTAPGVSVEEYDSNAGTWNTVSLGTSDWELIELDIAERQSQRLGASRVDAWTRWQNTTNGDTYPLDVTVHRGWPGIQFSRVPDSTSLVPSGLESLLSPVASDRLVTPQPKRDLRPREAIR